MAKSSLTGLLQELICFGVSISNANISELRDMPGEDNKYFESLKRQVFMRACLHDAPPVMLS